MKRRISLLVLVFVLMLIGLFLLIRPKQKLILNDTLDITEKMVDAAYRDLGYYQGVKLPISLNLEKQEDRFSAQEEFYQYYVESRANIKEFPDDFTSKDVIAYRFDLNSDGVDELIGIVTHPEVGLCLHGYTLFILMKKDIYDIYPVEKSSYKTKTYPDSHRGWDEMSSIIGFFSGVTITPYKTNGFYDLRDYAEGETLEKAKRNFDFYVKRDKLTTKFQEGFLYRFNNDWSYHYRYEVFP